MTNLLLEPFEGTTRDELAQGRFVDPQRGLPADRERGIRCLRSGLPGHGDQRRTTANPSDHRLTTRNTYAIPSGRSSYLRFDHADALDWFGPDPNFRTDPMSYYDGGFVEVSVDGAAYRPLGVAANGYNHTIN